MGDRINNGGLLAQDARQPEPSFRPEMPEGNMTDTDKPKIMWLSPMCSLDRRSGAAGQMRSVLSTLADAGWSAHAVQMTLFDLKDSGQAAAILGEEKANEANIGQTFNFSQNGVDHHLFYTRLTSGGNMRQEEVQAFYEYACHTLAEIRPDVVITYGGAEISRALNRFARKVTRTMIFYLANQSYDDPRLFELFDQVLVPSQFQADYYREKLGIESDVLRTLMPPEHVPEPGQVLATRAPAQRDRGFVAFVNPSLQKGATLFARLVVMAGRERPDLTFLAVEGRMTEEEWFQAGVDIANQPNVFWIPNQQDVRRVFGWTSILLFPSFWNEASGRTIAEAQLGGIPVLASNHAGMPEQLNGGGFTFDIPQKCRDDYRVGPTFEEVRPWLDQITTLMDDYDAFVEARDRALRCGAWLHPDRVRADIIERFDRYARGEGLTTPLAAGVGGKGHTVVKDEDEPGRNDPCPCGSGKKYKKCCLSAKTEVAEPRVNGAESPMTDSEG